MLKLKLKPDIKAVGVFVNEDMDKIARLCKKSIIDIVQLHGDEDEEYISQLKTQITNPVMKAARVRSKEDIIAAEQFSTEYLLLDAFKDGQYGGSGDTFDWTMITKISKPYFLAGGIHSGNVIQAITQVKPYGVDVSSGVETDGIKDRDKIIEIITKVRSV